MEGWAGGGPESCTYKPRHRSRLWSGTNLCNEDFPYTVAFPMENGKEMGSLVWQPRPPKYLAIGKIKTSTGQAWTG